MRSFIQKLREDTTIGRTGYCFIWTGKQDAILEVDRPTKLKLVAASDESVNLDSTDNLFIEGENLDALKLFRAEYAGKTKRVIAKLDTSDGFKVYKIGP